MYVCRSVYVCSYYNYNLQLTITTTIYARTVNCKSKSKRVKVGKSIKSSSKPLKQALPKEALPRLSTLETIFHASQPKP